MVSLDLVLTQILNGISLVMILVLVALGLGIIFGLMGVINLAHGELFTLGAYTLAAAFSLGLDFWIGALLAPIVVGLLGFLLEVGVVRHLYTRPMETILATWGVSLIVQQGLRIIFGPTPRRVPHPFPGSIDLLGVSYPTYRLVIIAAGLLVTLAVFVLFLKTDFGLMARAVIQNREMAAMLGVDTTRIYAISFALGAALAGFAGAMIAPLLNVLPHMGTTFLARSFFVVILGGAGSLFGVVGGSVFVGFLETVFATWWSLTFSQALVVVLAIVVVRFRPTGLFTG